MAHIRRFGLTLGQASLLAAGLLAAAPAAAQSFGPAGSSPPPAPTGYAAPQQQASNPAVAPFRDVLQRFGSFTTNARYGEVWTPAPGVVPAGWSPYPACHWSYDAQQQQWVYQDPTEWGAVVHHYGRWAFDAQTGWMWIADATPGPGWVYWKTDGGAVSWVALLPDQDGGQVPTVGWQSQDPAIFRAGCRPPAAPAPVAYGPAPAPIYPVAARVPVYPLAPPPPPPLIVYDPGRPSRDCWGGGYRPGCHPRPTSDCRTRPYLPHCRPHGTTTHQVPPPGHALPRPRPGHYVNLLPHRPFPSGGMGRRPSFRPAAVVRPSGRIGGGHFGGGPRRSRR